MYADDMVLLFSSLKELSEGATIVEEWAATNNMHVNKRKSGILEVPVRPRARKLANHSRRVPRLSGSFAIQIPRNAYGRISSAGCTSCLDQPQNQLDYSPHDSGTRSQRHPLQHKSI
jgi:hypothetical protein